MNGAGIPIWGIIGGGCCCFLVIIIAGLLAWKLTRGKSKSPDATLTDDRPAPGAAPAVGRMAQYGNIVSEISNDGFYILNEYLTPGSTIHYRYRSGGGWVTRSVPYQPGPRGHYVYLGAAPQDLQITDVVPPAGAVAAEDPMRTMIVPSATIATRRPPDPPKNYPSAY